MSRIYPLWKKAVMDGDVNSDIDFDTAQDGVFCALVDTATYTYSDSHQFYTDLSGVVGTDQRVATPSVSAAAIYDGDDAVFTAISGPVVGALVLYRKNSGASSTWRLISYHDSGVNLPAIPNGGNITVQWNPLGILQL